MKFNKDSLLKIIIPITTGILCWVGGKSYARNKIVKKNKINLVLNNNGEGYLAFKDKQTFDEVFKMDYAICKIIHTDKEIQHKKEDENSHAA